MNNRQASQDVNEVCFCGVDMVAEIANLSLQEHGLRLRRIIDDRGVDNVFFGYPIEHLITLSDLSFTTVVTFVKRRNTLVSDLLCK